MFCAIFWVLCAARKAKITKSSAELNITMLGSQIGVSDAAESIHDVIFTLIKQAGIILSIQS